MKNNPDIRWEFLDFLSLDVARLYAILKARTTVFVVEQNCVFQDMDDLDQNAHHLIGWNKDEVVAYLRILPPGVKYPEASLGRVITMAAHRGTGLGRELMRRGMECAIRLYPAQPLRVQAQQYLEKFYQEFGFRTVVEPYDEDGISHIDMLLPADK